MNDQEAFAVAVKEAQKSFDEGGVPVSQTPIKFLLQRTKSAETMRALDWGSLGI